MGSSCVSTLHLSDLLIFVTLIAQISIAWCRTLIIFVAISLTLMSNVLRVHARHILIAHGYPTKMM